jgi:hypothetical protein
VRRIEVSLSEFSKLFHFNGKKKAKEQTSSLQRSELRNSNYNGTFIIDNRLSVILSEWRGKRREEKKP